ncbi:hypothetical protein [uncultured Clostridium sp.]|uniref:hypothetical protein n=1 Tax=uncultured Clostridium sp. TaxID=59620 RepID=UPI0025FC7A02|nr:hypothetical protein [uncultured Clostridium sp.]
MGGVCKVKKEDLKYAVQKIDYWYKKHIKFLTIITVPFNTSCIFADIIDKLSRSGERVLYVWGKDMENRELINSLREFNSQISYSYFKKSDSNTSLIFVNYKNLDNVHEEYDLVIYDDITYFSNLSNSRLLEYVKEYGHIGKRSIVYSIEKLPIIGEKFELSAYNYEQPFVEPRVMPTRIDLNTDIPYTLYDYLKWFKESNHKVAILVPDNEKVKSVYEYFDNKLKLSNVKVIKALEKNSIKKIERVLKYKDKSIFIITNQVEELLESCYIDDVVILFSDNIVFNYKRLLYICGAMRNMNYSVPEVLLVSNSVSEEMDKAKDIARQFNKIVWEKSLRHL